ncbi:MAG: tetratricopeptide repeat protein [Candidatus Obscuribacterales bacterium]|nr:tetratricopeptide repeat protein [Candidatus Obscuribacterales bacterium]
MPVRGEFPQSTVTMLNRCRMEGAKSLNAHRPKSAARHHRRIIKTIKSAGLADDPLVVSSIHSLGQIFLNFGEHRLALGFLQEAHAISIRVFGKSEISTIMIETDYALTLQLLSANRDFESVVRALEWHFNKIFGLRSRSKSS